MDDLGEGPAPDAEDSGGIVSFLTSIRGVISTIAALVVAVGGLLTALNQIGLIGGDDAATAGTTATGTTTGAATTGEDAAGLFAPATRPNGRVYFDGGTMYVRASTPGRPLLHLAERGEPIADVSLRVRATWVSGAADYGVGLVCRYENAANYYLLSLLSGGRYNIVRYRNGRGESLTRGIQRAPTAPEGPTVVYAKCTGEEPASLTLTVDGRALATVRDVAAIESGTVGLRVGSSESFVTFRFEDVVLRDL